GILVVVAYNMSEWRSFKGLFRNSKSEVAVLLTTFFLTVVFDLTIAIEIGLLLALFLFVRRVSKNSEIQIFHNQVENSNNDEYDNKQIPEKVDIFRINGPFFFGVANKFEEAMKQVKQPPKIRIIDMQKVPFVDASGLQNLNSFYVKCHSEKIRLILARVNPTVLESIKTHSLYEKIGKEFIFSDIQEAVQKAENLLKAGTC
ncbi:MAG: STAS domain-containing protein, partial [Bacteroidales bacterium]